MNAFSKHKKTRVGLLVFISLVFLVGSLVLIKTVLAVTTNSNNNAAAQIVSLNETDFLVMDFNINVAGDSSIIGTVPTGGTAVAADKPAGWSVMKFNDAATGAVWNVNTDWIGVDANGDDYYNSGYVTRIDCDGSVSGDIESGGALCSYHDPSIGDALVRVQASDGLCTDSLTAPTCVYLGGATGCTDSDEHDGHEIRGVSACDTMDDILVTASAGWAYADNDNVDNAYGNGENLFKEWGTMIDMYFETTYDTTIAGTAPSSGRAIASTKPNSWTTTKFYDDLGGGAWGADNDWIGLDADIDGYYLDKLNTLTADLSDAATINALSDTTNVKFWLDGGASGFQGTGTDVLLGTPLTSSAYDSGGSGWYLSGLNRALVAGANRFFVSMTINSAAGNNELIKTTIPQYVDSDNDRIFDIGDRGMFLNSRVLGNVTNVNSMTVDAIPPTVEITMSDDSLKVNDTALVTFTFSEPVTDFSNADLAIANGTLTPVASSDSITWTATFTPTPSLPVDTSNVITVDKTHLYDVPGNPGVGSTSSSNYEIDTVRPTLSSAVFTDNKLKISDTSLVTFTFSEAVVGFTNDDLSIVNGALTAVTSADGGTTWTATFTPNNGVQVLNNVIAVNMAGVSDKNIADANIGTGSTNSSIYDIDTVRPTLNSAIFTDPKLKISDTSLVTFVFSEPISGFTNSDLTIVNGALSAVGTTDTGTTWTATFTPSNGVEDLENTIILDLAGVNDTRLTTDSNAGTGTTTSSNYEIDTIRPTLSSAIFTDPKLKVNDTSLVTFVFSEPISGLTNTDLTINRGTLTTVGATDSGTTWTATFTPNSDVEDLSNVIAVDLAGVNDIRLISDSNAGTGSTNSSNYEIDTVRPTLVSAVFGNDGLLIGSTSTVTFVFSEAVSDFTNSDLIIPHATSTAVSSADGITWTAILTPDNGVEELVNTMILDMTGVSDMLLVTDANTGISTATSSNYRIDTIRPTVAITLDDDSLIIDDTAAVTFQFSEAITGFVLADDASAENGTLSSLSSSDNIVWTATLTPDSDIEDPTNVVAVNMAGINDVKIGAGNPGSGVTTSTNYAIDTVRTTFTMQYYSDSALTHTIAGASYLRAGTYYLKITASEPLGAAPTITIGAEGTNNDVVDGVTTLVSGNNYKYTRVIVDDAAAIGTVIEDISITGADAAGNVSSNVNPTNEASKAIYTDTVAPVVNAGDDAGTVGATFTQDATAADTGGSGINSYLWSKDSGIYNVSFGTGASVDTTVSVNGGGPYTLRLTVTDVAGNVNYDTATFTWGTYPSSGGISMPSGVGGGSRDATKELGAVGITVDAGKITSTGVNVLTYISNTNTFTTPESANNWLYGAHGFRVTELDLAKNIVTVVFDSNYKTIILGLGDNIQIDLDGDNIKDISATFSNVYINRAEITIKSLYEAPVAAVIEAQPVIPVVVSCPSAAFNRDLKVGMTGNDVKELQKYLNGHNFKITNTGAGAPGKETTYFGKMTQVVLVNFQKANGLKATGIFDAATRNYLGCRAVIVPVKAFNRDLKQGMTGADVKALQIYLNQHGFIIAAKGAGSPGNETTNFGSATKAALIKFQQANKLNPASGVCGLSTRNILNK